MSVSETHPSSACVSSERHSRVQANFIGRHEELRTVTTQKSHHAFASFGRSQNDQKEKRGIMYSFDNNFDATKRSALSQASKFQYSGV